jgi:ribose/xylose/arabinose/galactoside ABC-type transport system permease subunit
MTGTTEFEPAARTGTTVPALGRFLLRTKLYWGLILLVAVGILTSPVNSRGVNIFLSPGNLSDVLRQVSNNGIVAVGMTLVILTAGIDLSVGSILALGSVLCAMLLTQPGWSSAALLAIPIASLVVFGLVAALVVVLPRALADSVEASPPPSRVLKLAGLSAGAVAGGTVAAWTIGLLPGKFGIAGVLLVVPLVGLVIGALNGFIITKGRLQPFIVTLAMMVGILGVARLVTGPDSSVFPVYAGTNATPDVDQLRALLWRVLPIPGLFFLAAALIVGLVLRTSTFGRYIYAIGGNDQAARLSGIAVDRVKMAVYALSGLLASLAGVLYTAQYLQGKPDAGEGIELDAIAAVVIGGTSLMGGKGSMAGTLVGVLIFGFLGNILQLNNIDSNTQLVLKGAIILGAVLLQEGQAGPFGRRLARILGRRPPGGAAGSQ